MINSSSILNIKGYESKNLVYRHSFPEVFDKAIGDFIYSVNGVEFLDFFMSAGSLNYGHNNPVIKKEMITYIENNGIINGLDFNTVARQNFINKFFEVIGDRFSGYKIFIAGPTGTNAIEAALKFVRNAKKRTNIICFSGSFHGMSLGSLAVSSSNFIRSAAQVPLYGSIFIPYPTGYMSIDNSLELIEKIIHDPMSGVDKPAAVLLEVVQGDGGINVAPKKWLQSLHRICKENDIMLIIDDIQAGCGRTGQFFSFDDYGIIPDVVVLSKSISGIGLPMSLVLVDSSLDVLDSGQHTGTFRGNQLAYVAATAALDFWLDNNFTNSLKDKMLIFENCLMHIKNKFPFIEIRGKGMMWGLSFEDTPKLAGLISKFCFNQGLLLETCGRNDGVVKLLPAITVANKNIEMGFKILESAIESVI